MFLFDNCINAAVINEDSLRQVCFVITYMNNRRPA